jgi:hypothetical protein
LPADTFFYNTKSSTFVKTAFYQHGCWNKIIIILATEANELVSKLK